jgi:hypothetical protein
VKTKAAQNQKDRSLRRQKIAKPIPCAAPRQEGYLFWDSEKSLARAVAVEAI